MHRASLSNTKSVDGTWFPTKSQVKRKPYEKYRKMISDASASASVRNAQRRNLSRSPQSVATFRADNFNNRTALKKILQKQTNGVGLSSPSNRSLKQTKSLPSFGRQEERVPMADSVQVKSTEYWKKSWVDIAHAKGCEKTLIRTNGTISSSKSPTSQDASGGSKKKFQFGESKKLGGESSATKGPGNEKLGARDDAPRTISRQRGNENDEEGRIFVSTPSFALGSPASAYNRRMSHSDDARGSFPGSPDNRNSRGTFCYKVAEEKPIKSHNTSGKLFDSFSLQFELGFRELFAKHGEQSVPNMPRTVLCFNLLGTSMHCGCGMGSG